MDTNDKDGLLSKFGRKAYPPLGKPAEKQAASPDDPDEDDDQGYKALSEHREKKGNPRFRIILANGNSYGCGYAYMLGWFFEQPDTLTIYTTTHIFVLSGENLQRIERALLREKVNYLREYNPQLDTRPPGGEPLIDKIGITSRFEQQ